MTKQKTLRESSKRLTKRYKFKRTLATRPSIVSQFRERDYRINRVRPVKDVLIWEPMDLPKFDLSKPTDDVVIDRPPTVRISRDDTRWPFRIEYIEQLLDIKQLWVVVADGRSSRSSYASSSGAAIPYNVGGINLDMITIDDPRLMVGGVGHYRQPIRHEKEMRDLEKGINPKSMLYGTDTIWVEGRPNQCIDLHLCNILPHNLTMYNCAFYHRDVAHLYLDSLSEHIKRCVDRGERQQ